MNKASEKNVIYKNVRIYGEGGVECEVCDDGSDMLTDKENRRRVLSGVRNETFLNLLKNKKKKEHLENDEEEKASTGA